LHNGSSFRKSAEIIEKSSQKGWEFDTKFRPKGGEIALLKTEMSKIPWVPPPLLSWDKPLIGA